MGLPPSSPKLTAKYRDPLAEATAYNPLPTLPSQYLCWNSGGSTESPTRKNESPYRKNGRERHQIDFRWRKMNHQAIEAPM